MHLNGLFIHVKFSTSTVCFKNILLEFEVHSKCTFNTIKYFFFTSTSTQLLINIKKTIIIWCPFKRPTVVVFTACFYYRIAHSGLSKAKGHKRVCIRQIFFNVRNGLTVLVIVVLEIWLGIFSVLFRKEVKNTWHSSVSSYCTDKHIYFNADFISVSFPFVYVMCLLCIMLVLLL